MTIPTARDLAASALDLAIADSNAADQRLWDAARTCLSAGFSATELASALGISRATLYRRLSETDSP